MYRCEYSSIEYTRRDNLKRHQLTAHNSMSNQVGNGKRSDSDSEDNLKRDSTLKRSRAYTPEEENVPDLRRSNAISDVNFIDSRNYKPTQQRDFKFKHPFCMMVCGPSRSGKTKWVVKLLKNRYEMIDTAVESVLYCYAHWQLAYAELKVDVQGIKFHKGLPLENELEDMNDCLIVIDDLMNEAVKNTSLLNAFTEGSHHKSISVVFLMQNIHHKGPHPRTMSINTQYLILFRNSRDVQ